MAGRTLIARTEAEEEENAERPAPNIQCRMQRTKISALSVLGAPPVFSALSIERWAFGVFFTSVSPRTTPRTSATPRSTALLDCNSKAGAPSKYPRRSAAHLRVVPAID